MAPLNERGDGKLITSKAVQPLIHSFNRYLFSAYSEADTVVGAGNTLKKDNFPSLMKLTF